VQSQIAPFAAKQQTELQAAADAEKVSTTPNVGSHQKLFNIINAIGVGLSAAGASVGSHGREGGSEYVQQVFGEQQQQRINAQNSALAQKNATVQGHVQAANLAQMQMQNILRLHAVPNDMTKDDLGVQEAQQNVQKGQTEADSKAQDLWDTRGFVPQGYEADPSSGQVRRTGQSQTPVAASTAGTPTAGTQTGAAPTTNVSAPAGTPNAVPGVAPTTAAPAGAPGTATANALVPRDGQYFLRQQSIFDASAKAITAANGGKTTPLLDAAQKIMDDPNSTVYQIQRASVMVQNAAGLSDTTVKRLKDIADSKTAQTTAQYAAQKTQADIAKANAQAASAASSQQKNVFELGQQQREATDLATPDAVGFSSKLGPKEYEKRYDAFTKSKDYQTLSTLKGSYQQFQDTMNHIQQTGDMTGAESVVSLFNAIGISATPLAGKGFRINSNTIEEHTEARGMDQAAYQKLLSLKNGDVITPKQLGDYSNIAAGVFHNSYVNATDEAHRQGLPVDFLPQGGGKVPDPITARIFMDILLHTRPELASNKIAAKKATADALRLNGWNIQ